MSVRAETEARHLLLQDVPTAGESLPGYIVGLGIINTLPFYQPWAVLDLIAPDRRGVDRGYSLSDEQCRHLAELTLLPVETVSRLTIRARAHHWGTVAGTPLRPDSVYAVILRTRFCPLCLAEERRNPFGDVHRYVHHNWWAARGAGVCPVHRVPLCDCCPHCGAGVTVESLAVGGCSSMESAHSIAGPLPESVPSSDRVTAAQRTWYDALEGGGYPQDRLANLPRAAFIQLVTSLRSLLIKRQRIRAAERDGMSTVVAPMTGGKRTAAMEEANAVADLVAALSGLPDSWVGLIEECRGMPNAFQRRMRLGTLREFGPLLSRLQMLDVPTFRPILEATEMYLRTRWRGSIVIRPPFGTTLVADEGVVNTTKAARRLGAAESSVRAMVAAGRLRGQLYRSGKQKYARIDAASLEAEEALRAACVTQTTAMKLLGVSYKGFHSILSGGIIRLAVPAGPRQIHLIRRDDIERLLTEVRTAVHPPQEGEPVPTISFSRLWRRLQGGASDALRAILGGGLRGVSGRRLCDLRMTEGSVREVVRTRPVHHAGHNQRPR